MLRMDFTTNAAHLTAGYQIFPSAKEKFIGHGGSAFSLYQNLNIDDVFEFYRAQILARSSQAWPTDLFAIYMSVDAGSKGTKKFMFGSFHKNEEAREMNEPGEIHIDKFDSAFSMKHMQT